MLTDPREIEIASRARQKNIRDKNRSRAHFYNIFEDFLGPLDLTGQRLLDLGPGQFDFGIVARERGAETVGIDNDPAVVELGEYKGFKAIYGRIQDVTADSMGGTFDGVFCKFSVNCFWHWDDPAAQDDLVDRIAGLMKPDAWSWIAPWNGVPKAAILSEAEIQETLDRQRERFRHHGYRCFELPRELAARYGVTGTVANHALFTRNLDVVLRASGGR